MARWKAGGPASLALAVCAALLLGGCVGSGGTGTMTGCDTRRSKTVQLRIKLKENGAPDKVEKDNGANADKISVCPGDYVVWKLDGSEFSLQFKDTGRGKLPFDWTDGKKKAAKVKDGKWKLIDVVREDVERDVDLKYDVINLVDTLDPLIIVER